MNKKQLRAVNADDCGDNKLSRFKKKQGTVYSV